MRRFSLSVVFLGSVLVLSGYLMTRGLMPDAPFHQNVLGMLLRSFLADARLQREVLQAQAGVPANYDSLNKQISVLQEAVSDLDVIASIASGENARAIQDARHAFGNAVSRQEALVEQFKSASALAQNSDRIYSYTSGQFGIDDAESKPRLVLRSAIALSAFADYPDPETEKAARRALADLVSSAAFPRLDARIETLFKHGMLLIDLVPTMNELTRRIERPELYNSIQTLRRHYLDAYAQRERDVGRVQVFLLVSALVLGLYAFFLLYRLARGTYRLEQRLSLERAAAAISGRFLALPWKKTPEGIVVGLRQLIRQIGGGEANMLILDDARRVEAAYRWPPTAEALDPDAVKDLFRRASIGADQTGFLVSRSQERGTRSRALLRFSLRGAENVTGYVVLTVDGHRFDADDRALFGIVAETFRSAIERAYHEEERQKLQTQLGRAQRLEALGTLAGSVAHEFNNILGAVRGHAELAAESLVADGTPHRNVEQVLVGVSRAQAVIDKILVFGRRRSDHRRAFDAGDALAEGLTLLRAAVPDAVVFRLAAEPGVVLAGDVTEFQQIVLNLCNNAAHAMDGAGDIVVRLATLEIGEPRRLTQGTLGAGRYAVLEVRDNGTGIPPDAMERIFDPFFTTKASGVGTGLGLATVRDIVSAWEGGIGVSSTPDVGTSVQVHLPLAAPETGAAGPPSLVRGDGEAVLVVRSERDALERDEETIAALGYEPVGFTDPEQALAAFRAAPDRFAAAIIGETSMLASASALPRGLAALEPGFPVLVQVRIGRDADFAAIREAGVRDVLANPLRLRETADALTRHVRRAASPA